MAVNFDGAPSEDDANSVAVDPTAPRDTASKPPVVSSSTSTTSGNPVEDSSPSAATDRDLEAFAAQDVVSKPIVADKFLLLEGQFYLDGKRRMRIPGRAGYEMPTPRLRMRAPIARKLGGVDLSEPTPPDSYPNPCLREKTPVPKPQNKLFSKKYLVGAGVIAALLIGVVAFVLVGNVWDAAPDYGITTEKVRRAFKAAVDGANRQKQVFLDPELSQEAQNLIEVPMELHPTVVRVKGEIEFKTPPGSEYTINAMLEMRQVRSTVKIRHYEVSCRVSVVTMATSSKLLPIKDAGINLETLKVLDPVSANCSALQALEAKVKALEGITIRYVKTYVERELQPLLMEKLKREVVT